MDPDQFCQKEKLLYALASRLKKIVIDVSINRMIADSFYEKADLEQWLKPDIFKSDYIDLLEKAWKPLIEKNLSFVVCDTKNNCVGVALNFDARDEPELQIDSKLIIIFEFLEALEGPVR